MRCTMWDGFFRRRPPSLNKDYGEDWFGLREGYSIEYRETPPSKEDCVL